jgi:hypothetical protein
MFLFMFLVREVIQNSSVASRKLFNEFQKTCNENEKKLNHEATLMTIPLSALSLSFCSCLLLLFFLFRFCNRPHTHLKSFKLRYSSVHVQANKKIIIKFTRFYNSKSVLKVNFYFTIHSSSLSNSPQSLV